MTDLEQLKALWCLDWTLASIDLNEPLCFGYEVALNDDESMVAVAEEDGWSFWLLTENDEQCVGQGTLSVAASVARKLLSRRAAEMLDQARDFFEIANRFDVDAAERSEA